MRMCELRQKEVININTCKRLGYVGDVDIDLCSGCVLAIIVPGQGAFCGFIAREKEYIIPFCNIKQVGADIILVDVKEKDITEKCKT